MKSLFIPPFVALTVVLLTLTGHTSDKLMSELVMLREMPTYSVPHTSEKPPEVSITLPEPLVLVPFLPIQDRQPSPETETITTTTGVVRGQLGTMEGLEGILDTPPPLARGPVEANAIDPQLIDSSDQSDLDFDLSGIFVSGNPGQGGAPGSSSNTTPGNPLGNGVLVVATVFTTLGLFYMAFMAYEYRQRWMHSMTMQNDRYLIGGTFDMDTEDLYGGSASFSDGFGLKRHSI